jgi:DNA-binding NarL/FixJ family response regulator
MKHLRLVLADDHDIVLSGLRRVLDQPDFEVVGAVSDGRALVKLANDLQPDLIIADITMPLLNGIDAARLIRKRHPGMKFVFLSMHSDIGYASEALTIGNCGYVLKTSAAVDLPVAVRQVCQGESWVSPGLAEALRRARENGVSEKTGPEALTPRQRQTLQMLAEGYSVKEIAFSMELSPRTVEFHKYRLMQALGVRTVAQLVRNALDLKLIN